MERERRAKPGAESKNTVEPSHGFAAVAGPDARVLILGSLPGVRSLSAQQYYAHPQNAFWPIMRELFAIEGSYRQRCAQLIHCGIALWDVLEAAERPGSLDSKISMTTIQTNDIQGFLRSHPDVKSVLLNGGKAFDLLRRRAPVDGLVEVVKLPSTSPAYAAMPFADKLERWSAALSGLRPPG